MSIIGIDIGSSHCVMATVSRGSVHIIRNELSERQTPSLVSYTDERRLIGEHAQAQLMSNYKNTCRGIKNLIGMIYDDSNINEETSSLCPLAASENGLVGFKVNFQGSEQVMSATRVLASLLSYLVKIAEKFLGKKSSEVVLACPGWFTDIQRSAMLAASQIAGINCLRIFSEHTATALDYGIYRMAHFHENQPTRVAFVALGHSNTSVSIVEFTKEKLKVLSEASDRTLGGYDMDLLIVKDIANKFYKKTGLDCLKSIKHKLKLEEQASKIKKILSANSDAVCHLECFMEDYDINENISRHDFIEMCKIEMVPKLESLIQKAVNTCGIDINEINSIELVGGCTRIPWVISCVQNFFQKEPSRTLSSDECVARGCALQAAMVSVHYRVTDYGCHEVMNHSISLTWATISTIPKQFQDNPVNAFANAKFQTSNLMPQGVSINKKHKFHIQCEGPILAYVHYSTSSLLPKGTPVELGQCLVIPPKGTTDVYIDVGINFHGQFKFLSAYTMKMVESNAVQETGTSMDTSENSETPNTEDQESPQIENNNTPPTPPAAPTFIKEEVPMKIHIYEGKYTSDQVEKFKKAEISLNLQDIQIENRLAKMNELEASILTYKNRLSEDLKDFSTSSEKDSIASKLDQFEDWLYDNYQADLATVENQKEELEAMMAFILTRYTQFNSIRDGTNHLMSLSSIFTDYASDKQGLYSHVPSEKKQGLQQAAAQINNFVASMGPINPQSNNQEVLTQIETYKKNATNLQKDFLSTPRAPKTEPVKDEPMPEQQDQQDMQSEKTSSHSN